MEVFNRGFNSVSLWLLILDSSRRTRSDKTSLDACSLLAMASLIRQLINDLVTEQEISRRERGFPHPFRISMDHEAMANNS